MDTSAKCALPKRWPAYNLLLKRRFMRLPGFQQSTYFLFEPKATQISNRIVFKLYLTTHVYMPLTVRPHYSLVSVLFLQISRFFLYLGPLPGWSGWQIAFHVVGKQQAASHPSHQPWVWLSRLRGHPRLRILGILPVSKENLNHTVFFPQSHRAQKLATRNHTYTQRYWIAYEQTNIFPLCLSDSPLYICCFFCIQLLLISDFQQWKWIKLLD